MAEYIEGKVREKHSPEVISYEIRQNDAFAQKVCYNTIYSYIDKGILGVSREDLTHGKYKPKRHKQKENPQTTIRKAGRTIHDRPKEIETKQTLGHWEMDTVQGKMRKKEATLLVLTERASNQEIIRKLESKSKESVKKTLDLLELELGTKKFKEKFDTITCDNGKEFWDFDEIEQSIFSKKAPRTKLFYADAYCSWQRGANENANKMIRRWLPKYTSLNDVTPEEIAKIELWMNNYPRKKHNFKSANQIYSEFAS